MPYMFWVWLAVLVTTLIMEAITVGLISAWFSVGGFVAMLMAISPKVPWWAQVIVFVILSFALLLGLRPLSMKIANKRRQESKKRLVTNLDRYIDSVRTIIDILDEGDRALIKINDIEWDVIVEDKNFEKGDKVKILEFVGSRVKVEKILEEEK